MKRTITRALMLLMFAVGIVATTQAQSNNSSSLSPAPQKPIVLSPKMKVADVKAVAQFIQGVDLRGTEVDAYLDTRKVLTTASEAATKAGKKDEDVIEVEMRLDQAQNLFTLMQRGQLKGAEAEKWREIVQTLQDAVKAEQDKHK
ncbi:MAG: hypothetical protein J5I53_03915 [Bradyrhizobiaceae bacterium]|nr:hypothetical protein [Bradyrhizobiaceae bacterium]